MQGSREAPGYGFDERNNPEQSRRSRVHGDVTPTPDDDKNNTLKWVLIALAVLAVLLLVALGLDWIDFDSAGGDVDVEAPNTDADVDAPDADVDVDVEGDVEGDADADAEAPNN